MPSSALLECNQAGCTPLYTACHLGNLHAVQLLLAKAQKLLVDRFPEFCNARDNAGRTALFMAAEKGCEDVVCMLLHVPQTDASILDNRGRMAVLWAGSFKWESVKKFLERVLGHDAASMNKALEGLPNIHLDYACTALIAGAIAMKTTMC